MGGDTTPFSHPGYHAFYSYPLSGQGHRGSTVILVLRDIPFLRLNLSPPFETVSIRFFFATTTQFAVFISLQVLLSRE